MSTFSTTGGQPSVKTAGPKGFNMIEALSFAATKADGRIRPYIVICLYHAVVNDLLRKAQP